METNIFDHPSSLINTCEEMSSYASSIKTVLSEKMTKEAEEMLEKGFLVTAPAALTRAATVFDYFSKLKW